MKNLEEEEDVIILPSSDNKSEMEPITLWNSHNYLVSWRESGASSPTDIFMDDYVPSSASTAPPGNPYELVTAANTADFRCQVLRILLPDYFVTADDARYPLDGIKQEGVPRWRDSVHRHRRYAFSHNTPDENREEVLG
jgi:hypothetical protein